MRNFFALLLNLVHPVKFKYFLLEFLFNLNLKLNYIKIISYNHINLTRLKF